MKSGADIGRLRWVIWLLAAAVIIPSGGLLWLINHGLESERLVVRQRLAETYQRLGKTVAEDLLDAWGRALIRPGEGVSRNARSMDGARPRPAGVMLLTREGTITDPFRPANDLWVRPASDSPLFQRAWELEFTRNDLGAAAAAYRQAGDRQSSPGLRLAGRVGSIRCLEKAGDTAAALALAAGTLDDGSMVADYDAVAQGLRLRLRLQYAELLATSDPKQARSELGALLDDLIRPAPARILETDRILVLRRGLTRYQALGGDPHRIDPAQRRLQSDALAARVFTGSTDASSVLRHAIHAPFPLEDVTAVYGVVTDRSEGYALLLFHQESLSAFIADVAAQRLPPELTLRAVPPDRADGPEPAGIQMVDHPLDPAFPGWRLQGHAASDQVINAAARRQTALFAWIGVLVIGALLVAGATGIQLLSREIRFHRLKNDFVATVTHELKTPLASTRVLVDTLLENGGDDRQQRLDYLEMMARENVRLTGLIDRFLTFSRMERGKHSVALETCEPAELVARAVEAVQMHCRDSVRIQVDVEPDLPLLEADPDALVTVLVNLLDNAVKYTGDEKQIQLHACRTENEVQLAVTDNGVGIPRRARKRIFGKFYQVDQSLSRSVGGCGLGLSIVEYIVRQHHGRVEVDSKPGIGSTFTVSLPVGLETP